MLKMTLSVLDPEDILGGGTLQLFRPQSRRTRAEGIISGPKILDSGVRKILILAAVPKIPESYENIGILIKKTQINKINYFLSSDLKMINICLGLMTHSALHPCAYCTGTKNLWEEDASDRSLENISSMNQQWEFESGKKTSLKNYLNCSQKPLLSSRTWAENNLVIDVVPHPYILNLE